MSRGASIALLCLTLSLPSRADTVAPECAATSDAATLFKKGKEYYAAEDYERSHYCYKRAWETAPNYDVAGNLGNLEVRHLAKYADGATHLRYARDHLPGSMDAEARQATLAKIDELMAIAIAKVGTITIEAPEGAEILLGRRSMGRAPLREPIFVDPGEHVFEVRLAEHAPKKHKVAIVAGKSETLSIELTPTKTHVGASSSEESDAGTSAPLGIAALSVGGAAALASVVLGVMSVVRGDEASEIRTELESSGATNACGTGTLFQPRCDELADAADEQKRLQVAAIATGVAGAALLTTGLVLFLALPEEKEHALVPFALPHGGGVMFSRSF